MLSALCSLILASSLLSDPATGWLYQPSYELDFVLRGPARPYQPQPGDIMLATDAKQFWNVTFILSFAGQPHHSGIVVELPDGRIGMIEAGPHDSLYVGMADLISNLSAYDADGRIWIRRRKVPLTAEQNGALTAFALANDDKRFALGRLGVQLTPFRCRGPIRTEFVGKPHGNRRRYFCSELLMESCVAAGLLDGEVVRPAATYPRDVFLDQSLNRHNNRCLNLSSCWEPPARWTRCSHCPDVMLEQEPAPK